MNVINPEAVDAFCAALASQVPAGTLATWLRRNLRSHVLKTATLLRPVAAEAVDDLVAEGLVSALPDWLPAAVGRGDALFAFDPEAGPVEEMLRDLGRIVDRYLAEVPADLSRVSFPEALAVTNAWEREQSRLRVAAFAARHGIEGRAAAAMLARSDPAVAALWPDVEGDVAEIASLPCGHVLHELLNRRALWREGILMDNCVETRHEPLARGTLRILSLRDPSGLPVVTLDVRPARSVGLGVAGRFLPPDLWTVVEGKAMGNARPGPSTAPLLRELLDMAGLCAVRREAAWLGLPPESEVGTRVDIDAMARAVPDMMRGAGDRASPSGEARQALRILAGRLPDLEPSVARSLAHGLVPDVSDLSRKEMDTCAMPVATTVVWTVPNLPLTKPMEPFVGVAGDRLPTAYALMARVILDGMAREPNHEHRVGPGIGRWRDPLPFFAMCGLAPEWLAACAASMRDRRAWLDRERLRIKNSLRDPRLGEAGRAAAMNAVNVQIPRLLAACQPPAERPRPPAPAPARTLPAFRLPTRPAPRRRA